MTCSEQVQRGTAIGQSVVDPETGGVSERSRVRRRKEEFKSGGVGKGKRRYRTHTVLMKRLLQGLVFWGKHA